MVFSIGRRSVLTTNPGEFSRLSNAETGGSFKRIYVDPTGTGVM
jgi:hypothetical protein